MGHYVPTQFDHKDISSLIVLVVSLICIAIVGNWEYLLGYKAHLIKLSESTKDLDKFRSTKMGAEKMEVLDKKIQEIQSASRKDRATLLNEFVSIKKQLEAMGRNLAFLSVDVVDSTGMKKTEDPIIVARDFVEYRKFAERKLNAYGCIKSTWTPDGIMACFNTVDDAIKTAQALINGLKEFNQSVKAMKQDFAIRCGINAGYLLFDESLPLEEISDRVIDIAGHMQKHAEKNTIFLAKNIITPVESPNKFKSVSKVVDDLDVCEWEPNSNNSNKKS